MTALQVDMVHQDQPLVALSQLKLWERNYRKGDVAAIKRSIRRFGFNGVVCIHGETIMARNHATRALREMYEAQEVAPRNVVIGKDGEWYIPAVDLSHLSLDEAQAFAIADNRTQERGYNDELILGALLGEVKLALGEASLLDVGYTVNELDALLKESKRIALTSQDDARGPDPNKKLNTYLNAEIKQIVLYFEGSAYDRILERLEVVMQREQVESNTEAVIKLLEAYEQANDLDGWMPDGGAEVSHD